MKINGNAHLLDFDPQETRTQAEATHSMGEAVYAADSRVFRYAKVGASNISAGNLQLAPTPKTNHHNVTVQTIGALRDTKVTVTLGATAAVVDEYNEGLMVVNDQTGEGTSYQISSHPAADSSATLQLTLFDPIKNTALTTSSQVSLVHNTYNGVIEGTSSTQQPAGIPLRDLLLADFGWLQTKGTCPALADETLAVGAWLTAGTTTAGAVEEMDDIVVPLSDAVIGTAIVAGVDGEFRPIRLAID